MAYPGQGYGPGGGWHNQGPPQQQWGPPQQQWGPPQQQGYGYNQGTPQHHYPPQQGYGHPPPNQYNQYQQPQQPRESVPFLAGHGRPPPQGAQQFGHGAPQGYTYQYSACNGKRKALLIGINYFGQKGELKGCINDTRNLSEFLREKCEYKREDMVILTDDQQRPVLQPTKENILKAMNWLVSNAQPNDSLFLHYSGHGGQTKDLDGDEGDGFDEVIYPVDHLKRGHIVDDEVHAIVVKPLSPGVRLTAIFDSCHSGSMLDLPYIYSTKGVLKEPNLAKEAGQGLLSAVMSYARGDLGGVANSLMSFAKSAMTGDKAHEKTIRTKTSPADVILWSGSKDDQTSADATIASRATGAMSWAFISALQDYIRKGHQPTYLELLNSVREKLEDKYTQKPQLSCSHPLDVNLPFNM